MKAVSTIAALQFHSGHHAAFGVGSCASLALGPAFPRNAAVFRGLPVGGGFFFFLETFDLLIGCASLAQYSEVILIVLSLCHWVIS